VKAKVAGKDRPATLLVISESGLAAAGPGTFLSDLLTIAGGTNVLVGGNNYVTLDREKLAALDPAVVIQIMPSATPQQLEQAESFWKSMPSLRAFRSGRVHRIVDADALLPGFNGPALAAKFADHLHGQRAAPSTRSSP
jgi:iron complex transport system substrate-binding protein